MVLPESQFVGYFMERVDEEKPKAPIKAPVKPIVEMPETLTVTEDNITGRSTKPKPKKPRKLNID